MTSSLFEVGGMQYDREQSNALRDELIHIRDQMMDSMPEAAYQIVILTHTIGWIYEAMAKIWPEEVSHAIHDVHN